MTDSTEPVRQFAPGKPRPIWDNAHMRYWRCRCVHSSGRRFRNEATAKTCEVCKDERPPKKRYK